MIFAIKSYIKVNMDTRSYKQSSFFDSTIPSICLPNDYKPIRPDFFDVDRIFLTKGSLDSEERKFFVERICSLYPKAEIIYALDLSHNRIQLPKSDTLEFHAEGKKTLVFGVIHNSVRFSEEEGNTCPNYWHFSTTGFCPYGCKYCYLSGTQGVWYSPTIKIYLNLNEILDKINKVAERLAKPTAFYLGKLQDGLALDPLTAYATVLVPFFAGHKYARQILLTKSANVERLLDLDHGGNTILTWSLNPPEISEQYEENTPSVQNRLDAMMKCNESGYPIRAVIMPIIPVQNWKKQYRDFIENLLTRVKLERLTIGGICSYNNAKKLMEIKMGNNNTISQNILKNRKTGDRRLRYNPELRSEIYSYLIKVIRDIKPNLDIALCLEEQLVWESVNLQKSIGRCNCVL